MAPDIEKIKDSFLNGTYTLTQHASDRAASRAVRSHEIAEAVWNGHVIEDYPDDKYGPSCLILGYTEENRALHVQVSYPPGIKVITVYEPSAESWEDDLKTRKSHE